MEELQQGASYEFEYVVTEADTASQLRLEPGDEFPSVLATSRMIGLMEVAAARLMRPLLPAGALSVGIDVEVLHLAATLVGRKLTFRATFAGREGALLVFQVAALDRKGAAGEGRHTRAIVAVERFLAGAERR